MMIICSTKVVHCKKEPYDVYIGRAVSGLKGSIWANPFKIGPDGDRDEVIEKYHQYIMSKPELLGQLESLRGKTLGCWCKPQDCHGDVLVELLGETRPQLQPQLFDVPRTAPEQVEMSTSNIQEFRYSVTDVPFQDVGDMPVPSEYRELYDEYCAEVDWLPVQTPLWCALECHYGVRTLEKSRHKAYTKSLLCSGDEKKVEAAIEAMKRLLLKWDSSRGIAKLNADAYAAREQQKLRDKSAPKIRAWERECRKNPYYPDEQSLNEMKEREEKKLMERVQSYHDKWRSHPCEVQDPHMGDDGYMVVQMPEGWKRPQ